jgi:peptidyl-prolyl cis-trans isomerase C
MLRISLMFSLLICLAAFPLLQAQEAAPAAQEPAPAAKMSTDLVVATVQGVRITENEVLEMIQQMTSRQQLPAQQLREKDVLFYKDALESLIGIALLKNEGKENSIAVDQAKVDEAYKSIVARYPSTEEFNKVLKEQKMTEPELRKQIEENLAYQQTVDQAIKDAPKPSDDEIKKFYDDNPQYFQEPEQAHAAHILLLTNTNSTAEQKAEIKKKLEGIHADIESAKITFAEAAAKNSEDKGSAENGGDLGFFPRGRMVKPFEEAVFAAKPGTIVPIVETQFGYHLIKVLEIKPAGKASLDDAKDNIRNFLDRKAKQEAVVKHIEELKGKAKVEILVTDEQWKARHAAK